jgi:hypothetical protein
MVVVITAMADVSSKPRTGFTLILLASSRVQ